MGPTWSAVTIPYSPILQHTYVALIPSGETWSLRTVYYDTFLKEYKQMLLAFQLCHLKESEINGENSSNSFSTNVFVFLGVLLVLVDYITQELPEKEKGEEIFLRVCGSRHVFTLPIYLISVLAGFRILEIIFLQN